MAETSSSTDDTDDALRLLREAAVGRAEAQSRGALWPDYDLILQIAREMEADAAGRLGRQSEDPEVCDAVRFAEYLRPGEEAPTKPPLSSAATERSGSSSIA